MFCRRKEIYLGLMDYGLLTAKSIHPVVPVPLRNLLCSFCRLGGTACWGLVIHPTVPLKNGQHDSKCL